jgi:hypothetical protein
MLPFFLWLNYKGWLRSEPLEEIVGLDISYHGSDFGLHGQQQQQQQHGGVKKEYLEAFNRQRLLKKETKEKHRQENHHHHLFGGSHRLSSGSIGIKLSEVFGSSRRGGGGLEDNGYHDHPDLNDHDSVDELLRNSSSHRATEVAEGHHLEEPYMNGCSGGDVRVNSVKSGATRRLSSSSAAGEGSARHGMDAALAAAMAASAANRERSSTTNTYRSEGESGEFIVGDDLQRYREEEVANKVHSGGEDDGVRTDPQRSFDFDTSEHATSSNALTELMNNQSDHQHRHRQRHQADDISDISLSNDFVGNAGTSPPPPPATTTGTTTITVVETTTAVTNNNDVDATVDGNKDL